MEYDWQLFLSEKSWLSPYVCIHFIITLGLKSKCVCSLQKKWVTDKKLPFQRERKKYQHFFLFFSTLPSTVLITRDGLVFIAGWYNRCETTARCNICLILPPSSVFTTGSIPEQYLSDSQFAVNLLPCAEPICQIPPGCKNPKWVIRVVAMPGKKVNQFQPWKVGWLVCERGKVGFCSFTCRPYQFASDEGICCKLATIAPCWCRGLLAEHPTHEMSLRRILLAACQSSSPCFRCFDQSVMMFVNRMVPPPGIGKRTKDWCNWRISGWKLGHRGDEGWSQWCWNWFAATVSSTPVTFVTFTRLLRISLRALLHKFNLVFFHTFPASFKMPADVDCVYRVCNGQSGGVICLLKIFIDYLFAQNIHWLNWIWEF